MKVNGDEADSPDDSPDNSLDNPAGIPSDGGQASTDSQQVSWVSPQHMTDHPPESPDSQFNHNSKQQTGIGSRLLALLQVFWRSADHERRFLLRHRWDFAVMFWLPLLTVFVVWWIFSRAYIVNIPIGIVDDNNAPIGNTLIRYLDASPELSVTSRYPTTQAAHDAILARKIYGVVVIPSDFDKRISQGSASPVVLQVNAQYGTHSGIIQKGVQSVVGTLSAGVEMQRLTKQGAAASQVMQLYSPIHVQRINLFNTGTDYQQFLASTVIPALLHILAMVIGATTIGREIRDKTLYQWLDAITQDRRRLTNPDKTRIWTLIAALNGKFIWSMLAFTLWGAVALALAIDTHNASSGSWWLTFVAFLLLMMVSFWLGAIFTLNTYSLRMGLSTTGFVSAPSYAFAGVTYPYIAISDKAQYWSDMLPLTHYLKLHIAQLQMAAPVSASIGIVYGFILAVLGCMLLTVLLTRRALANPDKWGAR